MIGDVSYTPLLGLNKVSSFSDVSSEPVKTNGAATLTHRGSSGCSGLCL